MKRIISIALTTLLLYCNFGILAFADIIITEPETTTVLTHDLFVSVIDSDNLAAVNYSLKNADHYTMCIPLTDKEFTKLTKYSREELKDYLSNQKGINNLTNIKVKKVGIEKKGIHFSNLSFDQLVEGVVQPLSSQTIDSGVLTTVLSVANLNNTTTCIKKIDYTFSWSPSPAAYLTDSAAVGFSGQSLGLTNYTNISGWQQRMLAGGSTWSTKEPLSTSIAGAGVETHAIDPQYTDIKLQGGITFTVSNPKSAVTAGAYFIAFGQYAHTSIGVQPAIVSIGAGGFSWSIPFGAVIIKSTQDVKSNILTY